jgi:hypothetical protein
MNESVRNEGNPLGARDSNVNAAQAIFWATAQVPPTTRRAAAYPTRGVAARGRRNGIFGAVSVLIRSWQKARIVPPVTFDLAKRG